MEQTYAARPDEEADDDEDDAEQHGTSDDLHDAGDDEEDGEEPQQEQHRSHLSLGGSAAGGVDQTPVTRRDIAEVRSLSAGPQPIAKVATLHAYSETSTMIPTTRVQVVGQFEQGGA